MPEAPRSPRFSSSDNKGQESLRDRPAPGDDQAKALGRERGEAPNGVPDLGEGEKPPPAKPGQPQIHRTSVEETRVPGAALPSGWDVATATPIGLTDRHGPSERAHPSDQGRPALFCAVAVGEAVRIELVVVRVAWHQHPDPDAWHRTFAVRRTPCPSAAGGPERRVAPWRAEPSAARAGYTVLLCSIRPHHDDNTPWANQKSQASLIWTGPRRLC